MVFYLSASEHHIHRRLGMDPIRDACHSRGPPVRSGRSVRGCEGGWCECLHNILACCLSFTAKPVRDRNPLWHYFYLSDVRRNLRDNCGWPRNINQHPPLLHLPHGVEFVSDRPGRSAWRYRGNNSNSCRQGHAAAHDRANCIRKELTHGYRSFAQAVQLLMDGLDLSPLREVSVLTCLIARWHLWFRLLLRWFWAFPPLMQWSSRCARSHPRTCSSLCSPHASCHLRPSLFLYT